MIFHLHLDPDPWSHSHGCHLQSQEGGKLYCAIARALPVWQDGQICCPKERLSEENWPLHVSPISQGGTDGFLQGEVPHRWGVLGQGTEQKAKMVFDPCGLTLQR